MNTEWMGLLDDSLFIQKIYSKSPDLSRISLHDVILHRDAETVKLRFDVVGFPDRPPQKWVEHQFNRVQISLAFYSVSELRLEGWGSRLVGSLFLGEFAEGVGFTFSGDHVKIEGLSAGVHLEGLVGYCDSEEL